MVIPVSPRRPVVLLVDDDADTLDMYAIGLTAVGFQPFITSDGAGVARQADHVQADVVVTDLRLHGTTGWSVMESLKPAGDARGVPVVLLTGYSDARIDRQAHELGCAAVLTKPCTPDDLAEVLRRVLTAVASAT